MTTTLDKLTKATRNARNATNPAQRDAARRFVVRRAQELTAERTAVMARLDKGYAWCERHPEHPDLAQTEDAWIADLAGYVAMEDALADALTIFTEAM